MKRNIRNYLDARIHDLWDIVFNWKEIAKEQYDTLVWKTKLTRELNRYVSKLASDALIIWDQIWIYKPFIFSRREKIFNEEDFWDFYLEYKVANKRTISSLNYATSEIELNEWEQFVEIHTHWDVDILKVKEQLESLKIKIKNENNRYNWDIKYIVWVSDLAKFATRYWFDYEEFPDHAQSKNRFHHLKNSLIISNMEVLWHRFERFFWQEERDKNPQKLINSRKKRKIWLFSYKI